MVGGESHGGASGVYGGEPVAVLDRVCYGYEAGEPVVWEVSAQLDRGRMCALIGPNAAGKSTLLKLLLGQLNPWSGDIKVAKASVERLNFAQRARLISYVPQKGGVSFAFTVRQVVAMGCYAIGVGDVSNRERVERAMSLCDLAGLEDRIFARLSVGQQQRVLLARALAQSFGAGRLMLLDEPASGMDLKHVHQTMRLLKRIAAGDAEQAGPGVLIVMHDINLAGRYADDVWLMDRGKLVAAGPGGAVLIPDRLASVYGVGFKAMTPPTDGTDAGSVPVFWIDPADTINERSDPRVMLPSDSSKERPR